MGQEGVREGAWGLEVGKGGRRTWAARGADEAVRGVRGGGGGVRREGGGGGVGGGGGGGRGGGGEGRVWGWNLNPLSSPCKPCSIVLPYTNLGLLCVIPGNEKRHAMTRNNIDHANKYRLKLS